MTTKTTPTTMTTSEPREVKLRVLRVQPGALDKGIPCIAFTFTTSELEPVPSVSYLTVDGAFRIALGLLNAVQQITEAASHGVRKRIE